MPQTVTPTPALPLSKVSTSHAAMPLHEWISLPQEKGTWLVESILPPGGMINIFGAAKSKKTILATQLALALTTGASHFMLWPVLQPAKVFYLQLDTPRSTFHERWCIWQGNGVQLPPLDDPTRFVVADRQSSPWPFDILTLPHAQWLKDEMLRCQSDVLIVDTLRRVYKGDENDSDTNERVLQSLHWAAGTSAVIIISHAKKRNPDARAGEGDLLDQQRGSSNMGAAVDLSFYLRRRKNSGTLRWEGRAVEDGRVLLDSEAVTHRWLLLPPERLKVAFEATLYPSTPWPSDRARARVMADHTQLTEDKCRHFIRAAEAKGIDAAVEDLQPMSEED